MEEYPLNPNLYALIPIQSMAARSPVPEVEIIGFPSHILQAKPHTHCYQAPATFLVCCTFRCRPTVLLDFIDGRLRCSKSPRIRIASMNAREGLMGICGGCEGILGVLATDSKEIISINYPSLSPQPLPL